MTPEQMAQLAEEMGHVVKDTTAALVTRIATLEAALRDARPERGEKGADGAPGVPGEPGPAGVDGRDGKDGEKGADGVPGKDGRDGRDGKDGRDGITREEFDLALAAAEARGAELAIASIQLSDDGRTLKVGEREYHLPFPVDAGTYQTGACYRKGDVVSWGGSAWIAGNETSATPGEGKTEWRLMVKRGRDGRDKR